MKPAIKFLIFLLLCSVSNVMVAQHVSIEAAKIIAQNHFASVNQSGLKSADKFSRTFQLSSVVQPDGEKDTLYYILNDTINRNFIIVSADQRVWPILAYSTEGNYNEKNQPEAFTLWMDNIKKEIEYVKKNNIQADSKTTAQWKELSLKSSAVETATVGPLIQTRWDQGCFYNAACPADANGPCGHAVTGCTATALAQIMKYWNYPTKGTGSNAYYHPVYGNISADFGSTTYKWNQMPNSLSDENDAVATLMYHCGVALEANYGPCGTSTTIDPRNPMVQYFNYSSGATTAIRKGFTTADWVRMLKSELDQGHPVWYVGSSSLGGHAFVCDGYSDAGYFHFNWGWSGSFDGYYYIDDVAPFISFRENQSALLNLVPGDLPDGYNGFFLSSNALYIAPTGGTATLDVCSSVSWTASTSQTWLSLSAHSGAPGKTTITFTAPENLTAADRSATITISAAGYGTRTVTVGQLIKINVTPGKLYQLIADKASKITHLSLKGSIDARDFTTMRDAMPALTDIDLSEVSIAAYTGEGGPNGHMESFPENEIPNGAFNILPCMGVSHIKTIVLSSTVQSIGDYAFSNCRYLKEIIIPSSVTLIKRSAFEICSANIKVDVNNPAYSSLDGVLFNKDRTTLIQCPVSKTGDYTVPSSVITIGSYAFSHCNNLKYVTISTSVKLIKEFAFHNCSRLAGVNIPASDITIEPCGFTGCGGLIKVDPGNQKYSDIDGVLFDKEKSILLHYPTSKTGNYTIPPSVTTIGSSAFFNCTGLTQVTFPSSVTTIKNQAFYKCSELTSIELPRFLKSIGISAFQNCRKLASVTIPSSIIALGDWSFLGCDKLHSIYAHSLNPVDLSSSKDVFNEVDKTTCTLNVPYGSRPLYASAGQWKDFTHIVEMPGIFLSQDQMVMNSKGSDAQLTVISSSSWTAASDQSWLTISRSEGVMGSAVITISAAANPAKEMRKATVIFSAAGITKTVEVTQDYATAVTAGNLKAILHEPLSTITSLTLTGTIDARDFKTMRDEMPALTYVDLSGVKIAAYSGTEGTKDSESYYYPENAVPDYAFSDNYYEGFNIGTGNSVLKTVILPNSLISIGFAAFRYCEALTDVVIPPKVVLIQSEAFLICHNINSINIPSSVVAIGDRTFSYFRGMINVDEENAFYSSVDGVLFNKNKTELIKYPNNKKGAYTIPSTVTSVRHYAFYGCNNLTGVIIPKSVKSIGKHAFGGCSGLTGVTIPSSVTSIEELTFQGCSGLKSVTIPASVVSIGMYAFGYCSGLTKLIIPASVKKIDHFAFSFCTGLTSVYAYSPVPVDLSTSDLVFWYLNKNNCTLYVPQGTKAAYQAANQWKDFQIIVEFPNMAPVADAGDKQIVSAGSLVILDGTCSADPEGTSLTYKWTAPTGISLSNDADSRPAFTAPRVESETSFTFSLVVSDGFYTSSSSKVTVTVMPNQDPVADAGQSQTVRAGSLVVLDGTGSADPEGNSLAYAWTAPDGISLNDAAASKPTFTAPKVESETVFTFNLIVNDGIFDSPSAQVSVIVMPNQLPVAHAGDHQTVRSGSRVVLDGTGSADPEGCSLFYRWTAPAGISLSNAADSKPAFTAPYVTSEKQYIFRLVVNDGIFDSPSAQVTITVMPDYAPVADAGDDQTVIAGSTVTLDGTGSADPEGYSLTYHWIAPKGISLSDASASSPVFTAPQVDSETLFTFLLTVNDGIYYSNAVRVTVTVMPNRVPVANAGDDQTVSQGSLVTLNGTGSYDPENGELTFLWTAPAGITLSSCTEPQPSFTVPEVTKDTCYVFSLVVSDGTFDSAADQVTITVLKAVNTSIHEITGSDRLKVYPNPTSGLLKISTEGLQKQIFSVEVYNVSGKLKLTAENVSQIDLSSFPGGMYLIKVKTKTQWYTEKVIKE